MIILLLDISNELFILSLFIVVDNYLLFFNIGSISSSMVVFKDNISFFSFSISFSISSTNCSISFLCKSLFFLELFRKIELAIFRLI